MQKINQTKPEEGSLLISTLVFTSLFIVMAGGLLGIIAQQKKLSFVRIARLHALEIAEAGANYYKWHLDNFPDDYSDGTGGMGCDPNPPYTCGPFTHDYEDPSGNIIGRFELHITPPPTGSSIVKIKSTGWTLQEPDITRNIAVRYGRASWAQFSVVSNSNIRFGAGTEVHGSLHSNGGIRFDGVAYNEVTSALETYEDTDSDACTGNSWGVHTCLDPADPEPPATTTERLDVFTAGRKYPVPNVDFDSISADLSQMQADADANGLLLKKSNRQGWHIQFLGNGQLQYRKVRSTGSCTWWNGAWYSAPRGDITQYQDNWTITSLPNNGIIFVEDNAWVDGVLNANFITVVAAKEPLASENADIWINNDILYSAKDGTSALGLIAQNNINIGLYSEDDLEINAALLAQKGRVGRFYYPSDCSTTYYKRDAITVYGSIGTANRYGFSWGCEGVYCSGYNNRNITFDANLTYSPPPSFPSSGEYTFISWEEILEGESY